MSKKTTRSVRLGRKIKLPDNRALPEPATEKSDSDLHNLDDAESEHLNQGQLCAQGDPFQMTDLESALPRCPSGYARLSGLSRVENYNLPYYEPQGCDSANSNAEWDEYWYPCESESSDFSQSAASFMSWSDEIEVETTKKVQEMYDEAERFLYDEGPSTNLSNELLDECLQWKAKFKHLRVVGKAIGPFVGATTNPLFLGTTSSDESDAIFDSTEEVIDSDAIFDSTEEVIESHSDSEDDDTLEESSSYDGTGQPECLQYDDVTMGSKCEADQGELRKKVSTLVVDGLLAYVWPKVEKMVSRKHSPELPIIETGVNGRVGDKNSPMPPPCRRPLSNASAKSGAVLLERNSNSSRLRWTDADETLSVPAASLRGSARTDRSVASSFVEPPPPTAPRTLYRREIPPEFRAVLTTPLDLRFDPPAAVLSESRAYHSALNRQPSERAVDYRRLSSLTTRAGGQQGLRNRTRQDEILRSLREEQERLLETNASNSARKQTSCRTNGTSRKARSGYSSVVLPPIGAMGNRGGGRGKTKVAQTKSLSPRVDRSTVATELLSLPAAFEMRGAGMTRLEVAKRIAENRTANARR